MIRIENVPIIQMKITHRVWPKSTILLRVCLSIVANDKSKKRRMHKKWKRKKHFQSIHSTECGFYTISVRALHCSVNFILIIPKTCLRIKSFNLFKHWSATDMERVFGAGDECLLNIDCQVVFLCGKWCIYIFKLNELSPYYIDRRINE